MGYAEEVIDLAIRIFFEKHKELRNYNTPEIYELEENGCIGEALRILREKGQKIGRIVFVKELIPNNPAHTLLNKYLAQEKSIINL